MPSLFHRWNRSKLTKQPMPRDKQPAAYGLFVILLVSMLVTSITLALVAFVAQDRLMCWTPDEAIVGIAVFLVFVASLLTEVSKIERRDRIMDELSQINWYRVFVLAMSWFLLAYVAYFLFNPCD